MANLHLQIRGTKELAATLDALGAGAPAAAGGALFLEGEAIMAQSKPLVDVDMGVLRASGHVQPPVISAKGPQVTLGYGGAAAPYAVFVHEGTGPAVGRPKFFPPPDVIEEWVRRVISPPADELKGVTYVIARAIGLRGLKPKKFLEKPFLAARAGMSDRLAGRLRAWLERGR